MSQSIDRRIVEMEFKNHSFENGIKESINSIDKLKQKLNFEGATKGLSDLENAGRSFSLEGIAAGLESVSEKFSAFGIMGITVLQNLTNRAIDLGIEMAKSLSVDQLTAGWSKYEEKTSSIQTIMNSTGKSIEEVNEYLNKLMWFSDETSYGFTDMTAALAQMTSSGGDIDNLIPLITGVANATAYAGKGAVEFSRAMYNLNQSYGAGALQYMDWKSLELAGVASQQLKEIFIEQGKALGLLTKEGKTASGQIVTVANFSQTLKDKWANTSVMEAAFGKFSELSEAAYQLVQAGEYDTAAEAMAALSGQYSEVAEKAFKSAQQAKSFTEAIDATKDAVSSGWMRTFEIIFGNIEEATTFWTDVTNVLWETFASGAEARNEMLSGWKDLGGRDSIIEALWNLVDAIGAVITPIKEAFRDIFPPMTAERLYAITEGIKEFTEKIKIGEKTSENLKNTFKGLFAIIDIGIQFFSAIGRVAGKFIKNILPVGDGLLSITGNIGKYITALDETIKKSDTFNTFFEKIGEILSPIIEKIKNGFKEIADIFSNFKDIDLGGVDAFTEKVETRFRPISKIFEFVGKIFKTIADLFKKALPFVDKIIKAIGNTFKQIGEKISLGDFNSVLDIFNTGVFATILLGIRKFIKGLGDITGEGKGVFENIKNIFGGLGDTLSAFQQKLKADALLKIAAAIGVLAASLLVLSLIDSSKLTKSLEAISLMFIELFGSMALFGGLSKDAGFKNIKKVASAMISLSIAVLILSAAMTNIAKLDWDELSRGLGGITVLIGELVLAAWGLSKVQGKILSTSLGLIAFSAALKLLVGVVKELGVLNIGDLAKGLVAVGILMGELLLFTKFADLDKMGISKGVGLIALSGAISILANALAKLGALDIPTLIKGVAAIGVLLGELILFINFTKDANKVTSTAIGMTILAASMLIFSKAIAEMGSMPIEQIGKGLLTMAGALTEVVLALNFMPKNVLAKATSLVAIGAALLIISKALKDMGGMFWEEIEKSLVALAGSFIIFVTALNRLQNSLGGAAAILVVSAALAILTPCLKALGNMSWEEIAKGIVALAGAFTVIGVAGLVLGPLVPVILGLSAAIALFGIGVAAIGTGVLLLSTGLAALSVSAVTAGAALITFLDIVLKGFVDLIPTIGEIIKNLVIVLADVFVECLPTIVESLLQFVIKVLDSLSTHAPEIVSLLVDLIVNLLKQISKDLPRLINAAIEVIMAFFSGVIDALKNVDTDVLLKGIIGVGLISALVVALSAVGPLIPAAMLSALGMAALVAEIALLLAAIGGLAQIPGLKWLIDEGGKLLQSVGTAIGSFIGGIVGGFMSGVSSQFPKIATDLSQFMTNIQPFIDGAKKIDPSVMNGIRSLADVILILTASTLLDGLTSWITGGTSVVTFGRELAQFGPYFSEYYESIKDIDGSVVQASANAAKALSEMAANLPNQGGLISWFTGENSITVFADELKRFGPSLKQYADSVKGIDPSIVINSANAAKALAEMAKNLPNQGGIVSWFTGDNKLSVFADELKRFGPSLKQYADSVKGIDPAVVQASANAAKTLSEMAKNLPNQGGIISWFTGDNTLSKFAKELGKFGPGMKEYADSVKGLDVDVVTSSVNAAQALAEMAKNLPNQGGIVSWFTGDNKLSVFAKELQDFGPSLKQYADSVRGLDPNIVINSANAAKALTELASNLPNQGGLISWFTGDNDLSSFGKKLAEFGKSFTEYYNSVYSIDTNKLYAISTELSRLIELAKGIKNVDTSGMSSFSKDLKNLGKSGIDEFINAFTNANERVKTTVANMIAYSILGANEKKQNFIDTFINLVNSALTEIANKYETFKATAKECIKKFIDGINDKKKELKTSANAGIAELITEIRNFYSNFYSAGSYLVDGIIAGIKSKTSAARTAAKELANAVAAASQAALQIKSPSRVFYKIGAFTALGFINALNDYNKEAYESGLGIAENARKGLNSSVSKIVDLIENNIDAQPVITPVIDLTNIQNGMKKMDGLLMSQSGLNLSPIYNKIPIVDSNQSKGLIESIDKNLNKEPNIQFVQNNYSPKALSRLDIYRQTKNQLSTLKGLMTS